MANILTVDSYLSLGLLYREILQEEGHDVFITRSGKEALDLALNERIDMAIVDENLPDFEAEQLLEELRWLQPGVRGILTISSDLGPLGAVRGWDDIRWDEIFFKSCDFTILQLKIKRLWQKSPNGIPPSRCQEQEHGI